MAEAKDTKPAQRDKAQAFKDLGAKRTGKAMLAIRTVGRLANARQYDYTPEQVEKICAALESEVAKVRAAFNNGSGAAKPEITL